MWFSTFRLTGWQLSAYLTLHLLTATYYTSFRAYSPSFEVTGHTWIVLLCTDHRRWKNIQAILLPCISIKHKTKKKYENQPTKKKQCLRWHRQNNNEWAWDLKKKVFPLVFRVGKVGKKAPKMVFEKMKQVYVTPILDMILWLYKYYTHLAFDGKFLNISWWLSSFP